MENEVKEPAPKYNYVSPEEYLAIDRKSEEKLEYYDGYVTAMSGAGMTHNQIAMNLYGKVATFLEGKKCQAFPSDLRVSTPNHDAYMYPDASIVCDEPKLEDDHFDTLINPSVIFEIWSPSTKKHDTGYKLIYYQNIPSLKEYIMIDAAKRFVQVVRKQHDGAWRFNDITETTANLQIHTIDFNILFDDLYRNTGL